MKIKKCFGIKAWRTKSDFFRIKEKSPDLSLEALAQQTIKIGKEPYGSDILATYDKERRVLHPIRSTLAPT